MRRNATTAVKLPAQMSLGKSGTMSCPVQHTLITDNCWPSPAVWKSTSPCTAAWRACTVRSRTRFGCAGGPAAGTAMGYSSAAASLSDSGPNVSHNSSPSSSGTKFSTARNMDTPCACKCSWLSLESSQRWGLLDTPSVYASSRCSSVLSGWRSTNACIWAVVTTSWNTATDAKYPSYVSACSNDAHRPSSSCAGCWPSSKQPPAASGWCGTPTAADAWC